MTARSTPRGAVHPAVRPALRPAVRLAVHLAVLSCVLAGAAPDALAGDEGDSRAPLSPGAHNWVQNQLTREGYRSLTLRGTQVQPVAPAGGGPVDRIDISGMTITVFDGKADARVDSVLLSPQATFLLAERTAHGDGPVRLVRDDIDVRGEGWTYWHEQQRVTLDRHVRVVFAARLPDILK